MSKNSLFRIRVLHSYPYSGRETFIDGLSWDEACEQFSYLVSACLKFPDLNVRCINIIKGNRKSIKMFQNHE